MLCNECGKNKATVHVTKIINGKKTETHLCEKCARKYSSFNPNFSMESFFSGLLNDAFKTDMAKETICPSCGMTYKQFTNVGKFGCRECYNVFQGRIMPVIKSIQGYDVHNGKIPKKANGKLRLSREVKNLKAELNECIKKEEYEKAAELRDKIRDIEKMI